MPQIFWLLFQSFLLYRIYKFLSVLTRPLLLYWIYPKFGWVVDLEPYKSLWTVVTGGTDGIGKAYTVELANRGFKKFILIGRNNKKLRDVSEFLYSRFGSEVQTFEFDFTDCDNKPLLEFLKEQENIGILVNSVGLAPSMPNKFADQPDGLAEDMLRVNAFSVVQTCQAVLPKMLKQNRGIIVNISSIQGWRPVPLLSTYSCSKAFVSFLSECLNREYSSKSIRIQCLVPLVVATKMSQYEEKQADGFAIVTPEVYAKQAVDIIGNYSIASGCIAHELQCALLSFLPFWILKFLVPPMFAYQKRRLLKKIAAEKPEQNGCGF